MRKFFPFILLVHISFSVGCNKKTPDANRVLVAQLSENFLYLDEIQQIIPPNATPADSSDFAAKYIRKWATDILMYDKAKQNISDLSEIERLVNEYRKTLTIHQYQQQLVDSRRNRKKPTEQELLHFYDSYNEQMILKENVVKGLLLIVPVDAPNISGVTDWVKKADQESIEKIEKYSLQNAISYDYFLESWVPFTEILRKTPFQSTSPTKFVSTNNFIEASDSTHHFFLRIDDYRVAGDVEPFEVAKSKIENILNTKNNADLISQVEYELYNDAVSRRALKILSPVNHNP